MICHKIAMLTGIFDGFQCSQAMERCHLQWLFAGPCFETDAIVRSEQSAGIRTANYKRHSAPNVLKMALTLLLEVVRVMTGWKSRHVKQASLFESFSAV